MRAASAPSSRSRERLAAESLPGIFSLLSGLPGVEGSAANDLMMPVMATKDASSAIVFSLSEKAGREGIKTVAQLLHHMDSCSAIDCRDRSMQVHRTVVNNVGS
jgi:hypothetical protein